MKKLFIIANWKSHKTEEEAEVWLDAYKIKEAPVAEKEVILCGPFTLLSFLKACVVYNNSQIKIGAQDVSPFEEGAYTGAVNAKQLKEFASYVLIGHSERRANFAETNEIITKKIQMAKQADLIPILCVQGIDTPIPENVTMVAFEPIGAIGSGHPDSPEDAEQVAKIIKEKHSVQYVLYGGSVTPEDV